MTHIVTQETYAERRAAMADESRRRILDATVAILARGVDELSMPAVAKEAGVSVPTVYRNFADKKTLLRETMLFLARERGYRGPPDGNVDDLEEILEAEFSRSASVREVVRQALSNPEMIEVMHEQGSLEQRRAHMKKIFGPEIEALPAAEREHAYRICAVLCSSATMYAFAERAGGTPSDAAATVAWAIRRILNAPKKAKRRGK
jgi:AcrR family transcriptional regulator